MNNEIEGSTAVNRLILHYLLFILSIVGLFYLTEIVRVFGPLFDRLYYGYITPMLLDALRMICYALIFIFGFKYANKHLPLNIPKKNEQTMSLKRVSILYLLTLSIVIVVTIALKFRVKLVVDLGENIGAIFIYNNLASIACSLTRMLLVVLVIRYVQEVFELLIDKRFAKYIPFGGIATLFLFGFYELFTFGVIGTLQIVFLFMHILYGEIYILANKYFDTTYAIVCIIHLL